MGFRNPVSTVQGIDSGNLSGGRIRTVATSDPTGFGRIETAAVLLSTGVDGESEAFLQAQSTPNLAGESIGTVTTLQGLGYTDPGTLVQFAPRVDMSSGTVEGSTVIDLVADLVSANGTDLLAALADLAADLAAIKIGRGTAGTRTTSAAGDITITHGLPWTPAFIDVQTRQTGSFGFTHAVTAITASDFTFRTHYNDAVAASSPVTFGWLAVG